MFAVIFEVHPKPDQWDTYLSYATMLRPDLEKIDGFVDNIRYGSLTRKGWIVSLSAWRDEKSLIKWRTHAKHHGIQEKGRFEVLLDYHLRVGQVTSDTHIPKGYELLEQRLDETQTGTGTTAMLINAKQTADWVKSNRPEAIAEWLGLVNDSLGLVEWDVFEAVLSPGDVVLLMFWKDRDAAERFFSKLVLRDGARLRQVRIIRDYGMFDRREAPQYYPDVATFHKDFL